MKKFLVIICLCLCIYNCESYGKKVESGFVEVYYDVDTLESKAQEVANYLDENEFSKDHTTSFKITKDSLYNIKMVVKDGAEKDASNDMAFMSIGYLLSMEVFNNESINFQLCNNTFNTLKTIPITTSEED
jgi:hypothetical protein